MRIEVRPVGRLRGADPLDLGACLGPVIEALRAAAIDLSRVRVVCDWIQYRSSFPEVADLRPVLPAAGQAEVTEPGIELAVDLRRCADVDLRALVTRLLAEYAVQQAAAGISAQAAARVSAQAAARISAQAAARVLLEPWGGRVRELHLAVQHALLAGPVGMGAGHRAGVREVAAGRQERREQHRRRPPAHPGAVQGLGRPGRARCAARGAVCRGTGSRQRPPGADLAR